MKISTRDQEHSAVRDAADRQTMRDVESAASNVPVIATDPKGESST